MRSSDLYLEPKGWKWFSLFYFFLSYNLYLLLMQEPYLRNIYRVPTYTRPPESD